MVQKLALLMRPFARVTFITWWRVRRRLANGLGTEVEDCVPGRPAFLATTPYKYKNAISLDLPKPTFMAFDGTS